MPNFEAAPKIEPSFAKASEGKPVEQPQALMTADGWIRVNDVEFKKDKQGRWRERTAFVNAPGVYANKERITNLNMENVANELGVKFEVKQKPEKVYEAQVLTEKQEKRLRKKPVIEAEIIEDATIIPFPPPLPKQPEVTVENLLKDIKKQTAPERAKEEKRAKMSATERAVADVVEITAEDVAAEHAFADKEIAGKKAEEEFDFLGKQPTPGQQEAISARGGKRRESIRQKENIVSKKLFEEFAALQTKKEELENLLATNAKKLKAEFAAHQDNIEKHESLLATKRKSDLQADELREAIDGIKARMKKIEDAIEYQTTLESVVRPLTAGKVSKSEKAKQPDVEWSESVPEIQLETPATREPSIYENLNELPNLADLRAAEQRVEAKARATAKKEPAIMRELQKDFGQMQEQLDYNQRLLKKLKEDAGLWKLLFNKEARAKIKHVEAKINDLHDKMDSLLGDRDIGEVIGERLIEQEVRGESKAESKVESQEQKISAAKSFEELYATLQNLKSFEGSRNKTYQAQELITKIDQIRRDILQAGVNFEITENAPLLNPITRTNQLRKKVAELLNAEISNTVEQKKAQAA